MKNLFKVHHSFADIKLLFSQKMYFNNYKFVFALLFVFVTFAGCNSENDSNDNKLSADAAQKLKENFYTYELKNQKYIAEHRKFVTEIYANNTLSGYLLQDEAKNTIGFSIITNSEILKYHDFITAEDYSFDLTYSIENKCNVPNFEKNSFFKFKNSKTVNVNSCENDCQGALISCGAVTVLAAVAIAASDGPLPVMDVIAVSTYVAGMANCAYNNKSCLRGC